MSSLENDIKLADDILNRRVDVHKDFNFIYSRTNENLAELFQKIDFCDKDIYSVLASSDFLFSAYANGAKNVDCFDINPLTYRYYHLRKWLLQFGLIDADGVSKNELLTVVKNHIATSFKDEQDSAIFWQDYISKINNIHFYSNILFEYSRKPEVPYSDKIQLLNQLLLQKDLNFKTLDFCSEEDNTDKKYDFIYLSNILDYNGEQPELELVCEKCQRLLKKDGILLCSSIFTTLFMERHALEEDIFSKYFQYEKLSINDDAFYYTRRKK